MKQFVSEFESKSNEVENWAQSTEIQDHNKNKSESFWKSIMKSKI